MKSDATVNQEVRIITIMANNNYGNRLQNYALGKSLFMQGIKEATLQTKAIREDMIKRFAKFFFRKKDGRLVLKSVADYQKSLKDMHRIKHFQEFNLSHIKTVPFHYCPQNQLQQVRTFISGSDQVWNPLFWNKRNPMLEFDRYLLTFAPPEKRIAYAASFGIDALPPEWEERMASELVKFKAISVREESGAKIVKKLTGKDVPVVLDPTMLLTASQWRQIKTQNLKEDKRYILTYFLGPQPQRVLDEVQAMADTMNAEVIEVMNPKSEYYTLGPDGFLEMIDHAQAVFTDSFHGAVFSVLFHRPFYIYQRHLQNESDMSNRLDTLLEKTQLRDCIQNKRTVTASDFAKADMLLEKEREASLHFLRDALQ